MGLFDKIANNLQGAYHQVNMWDGGRTWDTNNRGVNPGTPKSTPARPTAAPSSSASYNSGANDNMIKQAQASLQASRNQLAALQAEIAARPRLPAFDYSSNYARAQQTAAATVNPVYTDKLNRYLEGKNLRVNQETGKRNANKNEIGTALSQSLEDTLLQRNRTTEDTTTKIGDITATENSWQKQEGRQFDRARTALLGDVANAGLTESGIGQGTVQDAVEDRNLASADQVREFTNEKRDTELFRTRTLADLDTADTRTKGAATTRTAAEDTALRDFIDTETHNEGVYRAENEYERVQAVNQATNSAWQNILAQTVASLAGSGARAQDIALFKQVYG